MDENIGPSTIPLGICRKCKRQRLEKMNGKPSCPVCDIVPEEPSHRTVNVTVSESDFKTIINKQGYAETVPNDDPREKATPEQILMSPKPEVDKGSNLRNLPETPLPELAQPGTGGQVTLSYELLLKWLRASYNTACQGQYDLVLSSKDLSSLAEFIDTLPTPKSMKDARVLIQLQDRIVELLGDK